MFHAFGRWLFHGTNAAGLLAGMAVAVMMVHVAADVIGRYVLGTPLPATIAIVSQYYMVIIVFLPLALPERNNGHIAVDVLTTRLPGATQRHLGALAQIFSAAVYGALAYATWSEALTKLADRARVIESGVAIPIWPAYFALPAGCLLMALVLIYRAASHVLRLRSGLGEAPYAADEPEARQ